MSTVTHDEASDAVRIAYADETGSATAGVAFTTAQRYIEQQRAAEASTRALREAAERVLETLAATVDGPTPDSYIADYLHGDFGVAIDALRSALSPSPAQGGARHAWAPGQNARCVVGGNFYTVGRVYPVLAVYLNMITIVDDGGQELQVLADRFDPDPRDLVLVRKATS